MRRGSGSVPAAAGAAPAALPERPAERAEVPRLALAVRPTVTVKLRRSWKRFFLLGSHFGTDSWLSFGLAK